MMKIAIFKLTITVDIPTIVALISLLVEMLHHR